MASKLKEVPTEQIAMPELPSARATVPIVDQVLDMVGRLDSMRKQAVEDLLAQKRHIEEKLAMIGWNDTTTASVKASGRVGSRPTGATSHCRICEIDGHDARQHRFQGIHKKRFTPAELAERGLK